MLDAAEREQLLAGWQGRAEQYAGAETLGELISAQAQRTPEAVAVEYEGLRWTYAELEARSNRVARYLQQQGVGPEVVVGVALERSAELVAVLVGILKAGGAYLPLDVEYPPERLHFMLRQAGARLALSAAGESQRLGHAPCPVVCLEQLRAEIERHSAAPVPSPATSQNLAYVIYTSGSTGQPKGAMNTQAAIRNRLLWMQQQYGLQAGDAVLQKTPIASTSRCGSSSGLC